MENQYLMTSGDIVGSYVSNSHAENLGKIDDIVVDLQSGQIRYALLAFDEVWGLAGRLVAVPWDAFGMPNPEMAVPTFVLEIDRTVLKTAPVFDQHRWPDMRDPAWQAATEQFFSRIRPASRANYAP